MLGHAKRVGQRLAVVAPPEEEHGDGRGDLGGGDLGGAAEPPVDDDPHGAGRVAEHALVDVAERPADGLERAVEALLLVEGQQNERDVLLLRAGDDVLVDGSEVGDGRHGAHRHAAELLVGLEGDDDVMPGLGGQAFVPERHPVAARLVDHRYRR